MLDSLVGWFGACDFAGFGLVVDFACWVVLLECFSVVCLLFILVFGYVGGSALLVLVVDFVCFGGW